VELKRQNPVVGRQRAGLTWCQGSNHPVEGEFANGVTRFQPIVSIVRISAPVADVLYPGGRKSIERIVPSASRPIAGVSTASVEVVEVCLSTVWRKVSAGPEIARVQTGNSGTGRRLNTRL